MCPVTTANYELCRLSPVPNVLQRISDAALRSLVRFTQKKLRLCLPSLMVVAAYLSDNTRLIRSNVEQEFDESYDNDSVQNPQFGQ